MLFFAYLHKDIERVALRLNRAPQDTSFRAPDDAVHLV